MARQKRIPVTVYARKLGISPSTVHRRITQGHLPAVTKKGTKWIFPEEANQWFLAAPTPAVPTKSDKWPNSEGPPKIGPSMSMLDAERAEKVFKAMRQKLEYERAKGELINLDEVKKRVADLATRTRDAMQAIPDRVAPELAAEVDPHRVTIMLQREINIACGQLSDRILLNADEEPNSD